MSLSFLAVSGSPLKPSFTLVLVAGASGLSTSLVLPVEAAVLTVLVLPVEAVVILRVLVLLVEAGTLVAPAVTLFPSLTDCVIFLE